MFNKSDSVVFDRFFGSKFRALISWFFQEPLFYAYVILGFSLYTFHFYQDQVLLDLFDESDYLFMFLTGRGIIPDWGPLYSLLYWLESFFWTDPLQLYFQHALWLSVCLPIGYYFLLLKLGKPSLYAATFSTFLVLIQWNYLVVPKAGHFAILLLILGILLASKASSEKFFSARMTALLLVLSWVRPEYFVLGFFYFVSHWFFFGKPRRPSLDRISILGFLLVGLFWFLLGNPFHGGLRIWAAITQGLHWTGEFRGETLNGNISISIGSILQHIRANFLILTGSYPKIYQFLMTRSVFGLSWNMSAWLQILFLLLPMLILFFFSKISLAWKRSEEAFLLFVYSIFFLVISLTIFANVRHFFILPFLAAAIFPIQMNIRWPVGRFSFCYFLLFLISVLGPLVFFEPDPRVLWPSYDRKNVEFARSDLRGPKGNCLSFPQAFGQYLPHLCERVESLRSEALHGDFGILTQVKETQPTYLFVREDYWQGTAATALPSMDEVFRVLQGLGYEKAKFPYGEEMFWFRKTVLDQPNKAGF